MSRFVIRPVQEQDHPGLMVLARSIRGGLTTLPPEPSFIEGRIHDSLRAFDPRIKRPGGEIYLFVLEEQETGRIAGTSGIISRVGGFDPFYSYEIRREYFAHEPLGISKSLEVLHLKMDHKGPSEIGTLALHPDLRRAGLGRFLSLSRFLFVHAFPDRFDPHVIAEMRGYQDGEGKSPFWESVGRLFFESEFAIADQISGLGNKEFIQDLMPRHPIYVCLLPEAVRRVIGEVHTDTVPALRFLQGEGFERLSRIDIFDAGPILGCETQRIRAVAEANTAVWRPAREPADPGAARFLIANRRLDFRACIGPVWPGGDGSVGLTEDTAALLKLEPGEQVTFVAERGS